MEKKILKIQFYSLFVLTILNLIYFYYHENLPDTYYEISFRNQSVNFFSYYFFTVLVNFGYWCGIWIISAFFTFALISSLVFSKNNDFKNQIVIFFLIPFSLGLSYFFFPESLGEGLLSLLKENFNNSFLFVLIFFNGIISFYLVSDRKFLMLCQLLWKLIVKVFLKLRDFNYLSVRKVSISNSYITFKQTLSSHLSTLKIGKQSSLVTSLGPSVSEVREIQSLPISNIIVKQADFNDSIDEIENEEHLEIVDEAAPEVSASSENDLFFDSEELVNCIAPKNQSHKITDPSETYFSTISRAIEEKLKEFNIHAFISNVSKGPVVDTFELELGAGVKVAGVTNRTDDLSLALMGAPIRMVYPMKGKSTIGIEVPRNPRDVIYLDEVLKSPNFNNSSYKLPIAMGKDAYGDAAVIDLASTPHLLVAGTTGAGKSVFINTLLVSLIIKFSPKKLRLIMLDPKQLELALYQKLPHLIMPVVTDSSIASAALLWIIDEMERRYSLLKDFGVKNIEGFNKKITGLGSGELHKINKYYPDVEAQGFELPFIVVVVDEFADLMLSKNGKAIETSISRLAAKARASGIHIVLATQRPSTDIITGVIKANFPTRVSFRVFTSIDSRVILDGVGAEKLLGKGDMLFKQGIDILRMHSAYVHEDEIETLVEKLSTLPAQYDSGAMEFIENNGIVDTDVEGVTMDNEGVLQDDKYEEAVRYVATHRVASASFLQRRLGVGYNRAANLIEEMERHGVVGPAQGSKSRKVLVPPPNDLTP
jgi:S-DNA-T family DNA segregation ATPase FtsK/SpoIIIE